MKSGWLLLLLLLVGGGRARPRSSPGKKGKKKKDSEAARQERVLDTLVWTRSAAVKYGVPLPIVLAVLDVESHGYPEATSGVGAMGYMQLMPDTVKTYRPHGGADPYDPATNIDIGVHLLSDLYNEFGDWLAVFTAYNAGPARLRKNRHNYRWVYVNEVLARLQIWQNTR